MNMKSTSRNQTTSRTAEGPGMQSTNPQPGDSDQLQPADDLVDYVTAYARQNPGTAALWCFGVGFIVGWKLKPW